MAQPDYDVFVCCHEPSAAELASAVAAGLTRRGFRVFSDADQPSQLSAEQRRAVIGQAPDFVLIVAASGAVERVEDLRLDVSHAFATQRNVVRLATTESAEAGRRARLSAVDPRLHRSEEVRYDPARAQESIAQLSHRLSSDAVLEDRRIMRRSKRFFWAAALILATGIALQEIPRLLERWSRLRLLSPVPPFALYWAAAAQRMGPGGWAFNPASNPVAVTRGDRVTLVFSTSADGHAYVVCRDVRGGVTVLFPTEALRGASRVRAREHHVAPVTEGGWLTIDDDAPPDTVYLVAGYDPLQNLEELLEEPATPGTDAARRALLEATMAGLLDGRHGDPARRVWNGKLHPIDRNLPFPSVDRRASVPPGSGVRSSLELVPQPGLVSASVELKFEYQK